MGQTYRGVSRVDTLSTVSGRTHNVNTDIFIIDDNVHILCLRHHGNRRGRGMDTSAGLGLRHTLYTVDTALVLHLGVSALAGNHENDLLETADSIFTDADKLSFPAVALCKAHIHTVQFGRK